MLLQGKEAGQNSAEQQRQFGIFARRECLRLLFWLHEDRWTVPIIGSDFSELNLVCLVDSVACSIFYSSNPIASLCVRLICISIAGNSVLMLRRQQRRARRGQMGALAEKMRRSHTDGRSLEWKG